VVLGAVLSGHALLINQSCVTYGILDLFCRDFRNGNEKWFQQEIMGFMTFPKLFPFLVAIILSGDIWND